MDGLWWQYALILSGAAAGSLMLTPVAHRLAVSFGILDNPGGHKSHTVAVPYLGGLAIVVAFAVSVIAVATWVRPDGGLDELVVVMGLALALAAIGFLDDVKGLTAAARLLAQVLAAYVLLLAGVGVTITGTTLLDGLITIGWFVGITNAFNLLDNMDGLSAGVAAISAAGCFAVAMATGQVLVASLAIALAGCAAGFLWHNFHPASIYMGDGGALFLGFLIAYLALKLRPDVPQASAALVPIILCGVALADTGLVTFARVANGRSPFRGGRDHISHRLVKVGVPVPAAVLLVYLAAVSSGVMAFVVARVDVLSAYILFSLTAGLALVILALLWQVDVYGRRPVSSHGAESQVD